MKRVEADETLFPDSWSQDGTDRADSDKVDLYFRSVGGERHGVTGKDF